MSEYFLFFFSICCYCFLVLDGGGSWRRYAYLGFNSVQKLWKVEWARCSTSVKQLRLYAFTLLEPIYADWSSAQCKSCIHWHWSIPLAKLQYVKNKNITCLWLCARRCCFVYIDVILLVAPSKINEVYEQFRFRFYLNVQFFFSQPFSFK